MRLSGGKEGRQQQLCDTPAGGPLEDGPLEGAVPGGRGADRELLDAALKLAQLGAALRVEDIDLQRRLLQRAGRLPAAVRQHVPLVRAEFDVRDLRQGPGNIRQGWRCRPGQCQTAATDRLLIAAIAWLACRRTARRRRTAMHSRFACRRGACRLCSRHERGQDTRRGG